MSINLTSSSSVCVPGDPKVVTADIALLQFVEAPSRTSTIPTWEIALKISFYILAMLMDIVGNSIVILIIVLNRKMRTTTNTLIANLAVSDLMVASFCMWVHAGNQVTHNWPFGNFFCKVNTFFQVLAVTASVLTLMVIAVERFLAVLMPFKGHFSPFVTGCAIAVVWVVAIGTAAPQLAVRRQFKIHWLNRVDIWCAEDWPEYYIDSECNTEAPGKEIYYIIEAIVMYFLPIGVMVFAYSAIAYKLLFTKHAGNAPADGKLSAHDRAKRKVTKMLFVVLCVFIICWTPQQVLLLHSALYQSAEEPSYMPTVQYIALYLAYFCSAINPILYAGFNENFRKGFVEAFKCILVQRRNRIDPDLNMSRTHVRPGSQRPPDARSHADLNASPPSYTPNRHGQNLQVPGERYGISVSSPISSEPFPVKQKLNGHTNSAMQDSAYGSAQSAVITNGADTKLYLIARDLSVLQDKVFPMQEIESSKL
ncbi:neuropeptide ff receptor 2 [Plakobranchus ocellatus]|uniref:Neuropeptide ff receptor 2 n=1 Tax=Plakobranchus ocellatus TaxID=259542 RepID=A0AAV4B072_9GAST|nr:neuropeptide ff receptor 2 [Plakobranchus ocellatus]